jgi:hypothetical protein
MRNLYPALRRNHCGRRAYDLQQKQHGAMFCSRGCLPYAGCLPVVRSAAAQHRVRFTRIAERKHYNQRSSALSYADVVNQVAPAVVTIRSSRPVRAPQQFPFFR